MRYKLSNKKEKEWKDKKFTEADLVDTNGECFTVSAWKGEFDDKEYWEGELEKNDKGYWKLVSKKTQAGLNFKTEQIEKTMERKEKSISRFQDSKEFSIMVASSMSNAVTLAVAEYRDKTVLDGLDKAVLRWRQWILDNWEVDPKSIKPF